LIPDQNKQLPNHGTKGALDRGRDGSATPLEVIVHRKGFLRMLDRTNLTRREAYRTRVTGIWRCVENVSMNCPCFKQNSLIEIVPVSSLLPMRN